jgi:HD-GYP domain-containing protein (c-di-GMP phosphodiesterase class II)
VYIGDVSTEPTRRASDATLTTRSELDVPIRSAGRLWGAITVQEPTVNAFAPEDSRLFETAADQIGSALHSAALYEQLDAAYLGTAEALSAALEARDAYTASHSDSIVKRTEAVGRELGMSPDQLRLLRYGAAFHDIGKLAVPESILAKPGPLTGPERQQIEQHTLVGERILAPVSFLAPVLPHVRHAHERWDGGGYPDRLAGERIPLGARIIFACDAYDAMTTDRPYRRRMDPADAREELLRCSGTQFDPHVVEALIAVLADDPVS